MNRRRSQPERSGYYNLCFQLENVGQVLDSAQLTGKPKYNTDDVNIGDDGGSVAIILHAKLQFVESVSQKTHLGGTVLSKNEDDFQLVPNQSIFVCGRLAVYNVIENDSLI